MRTRQNRLEKEFGIANRIADAPFVKLQSLMFAALVTVPRAALKVLYGSRHGGPLVAILQRYVYGQWL